MYQAKDGVHTLETALQKALVKARKQLAHKFPRAKAVLLASEEDTTGPSQSPAKDTGHMQFVCYLWY